MNLYLVRKPDGRYFAINMYDEMDAIWNSDLGYELKPTIVKIGPKNNHEVYEVVNLDG